jgi:hypothetical protein
MKIRRDFVTNSSSSSFIISTYNETGDKKLLLDSQDIDTKLIINKLQNEEIYYINWADISCNYILTEDQMWDYRDYLHWLYIVYNDKLSEPLIEKLLNYFNFKHEDFTLFAIISNYKLSDNFLRKYIDKFTDSEWRSISVFQNLSLDFIRDFKDKLDWLQIYKNQELTEDFIEEMDHKTYWDVITSHQKYLSEQFIERHSNEINFNWKNIRRYQKNVSKEFIDKHFIDIMTAKSLKGGYKNKRD